jgi:hypothetical protein
MRDCIDANRIAEHPVREHERKSAHDETPHAAFRVDLRESLAGGGERGDQPYRAFDGRV